MKKYTVEFSEESKNDFVSLSNAIKYEYKSPLTAFRYLRDLKKEISKLQSSADAYQIQTRTSLLQYGANVRRINYKKMAVIYTIHGDIVYIHRIIPASMITGL